MARQTKQGLDYFPFDVDFFDDDKIQFVAARFGIKGEIVAVRILCRIYNDKGYYCQWNEDTKLLFAKRVGLDHTLVNDVVNELVKRGFFDEAIFNSFGVLTSKGIQERYFEAAGRRKKVQLIDKYLIDVSNKPLNADINTLNDSISTQSKVKDSKPKESKGEEIKPLTFEEVFNEVVNSESWIEETAMHFGKTKEYTSQTLNIFLGEIKLKNDWQKGISEVKKHFISWIKIELYKQKNGKQTSISAIREF